MKKSNKIIIGGLTLILCPLIVKIIAACLNKGFTNVWVYINVLKPFFDWAMIFFINPYIIGFIIGVFIVGIIWILSNKSKKKIKSIRYLLYEDDGIIFTTSISGNKIGCVCSTCLTPLKQINDITFICPTCDKTMKIKKELDDIQLIIQGEYNKYLNRKDHKLKFVYYN